MAFTGTLRNYWNRTGRFSGAAATLRMRVRSNLVDYRCTVEVAVTVRPGDLVPSYLRRALV